MRTFCRSNTKPVGCQHPASLLAILSLALLAGPSSAYAQVTSGTLLKTYNNPTPAAFEGFGTSVAAMGPDRVLISAWGAGEVYLFNVHGTLLTTFTRPVSPDVGFGSAVAAVGDDRVLIAEDNFSDMYAGEPRLRRFRGSFSNRTCSAHRRHGATPRMPFPSTARQGPFSKRLKDPSVSIDCFGRDASLCGCSLF